MISRKDIERIKWNAENEVLINPSDGQLLLDRLSALEKVREAAASFSYVTGPESRADWEWNLREALSQCPPLEDGEESK